MTPIFRKAVYGGHLMKDFNQQAHGVSLVIGRQRSELPVTFDIGGLTWEHTKNLPWFMIFFRTM